MIKKIAQTVTNILKKLNLHKNKQVRNVSHSLYFFIIYLTSLTKGYIERNEFDYKFAASFVHYWYAREQQIDDLLSALKANLDEESRQVVDTIVERYHYVYTHNLYEMNKIVSDAELKEYSRMIDYMQKNKGNFRLLGKFLDDPEWSVYYYKCGLSYVPSKALKSIKKKDIIDGGAYVGDSAELFSRMLSPRRIYAFEPSDMNFSALKKTLSAYNIDNVVPIKKGIAGKKDVMHLVYEGVGSYLQSDAAVNTQATVVISIDKFVKENKAEVKLIKLDIEGYELEAIKGAKQTIKKYKPILSVAMYHAGKDFFEIKPLIEKWVKGYKFIVRKLNPTHPFFETTLIGYYEP